MQYKFKENINLLRIYPSAELENKHVTTARSHCLVTDQIWYR